MRFSTSQDNKWLGVLLERYTLLLFGVCMKYLKNEEEARDSVQQVFLKAITELQKYKVEYFKSWIYMVAKNHCLMKLRDRQGKIPTELEDNHPAEETDRNQLVETDKNLERMAEALEELNKEQKQCITLFYLEKKSYQQVAGETGFSLMQVKSYIQNGKRNLKIIMERKATDR
ncbi:MAG: sigma-70 family RNA polymerase sigma factor [Chitinophagaceae bacterium]|nr:sigma-70 family RNA polymerase sigma factor [Chitinophagaceae bacterium]